jgi:hypothetical protein
MVVVSVQPTLQAVPDAFASGIGRYRDRAKGRKREGRADNARGDESGKMVDQ